MLKILFLPKTLAYPSVSSIPRTHLIWVGFDDQISHCWQSPSSRMVGDRPTTLEMTPAAKKVGAFLRHGAAAGLLQGLVPQYINSSVRLMSSEAYLQSDSRVEKGFKCHDMLVPFTVGWQSTDLHPLIIERSEGSYVYDMNGKKYLDALAGLWCTAIDEDCEVMDGEGENILDRVSWKETKHWERLDEERTRLDN